MSLAGNWAIEYLIGDVCIKQMRRSMKHHHDKDVY